jgi:hypothetical protein
MSPLMSRRANSTVLVYVVVAACAQTHARGTTLAARLAVSEHHACVVARDGDVYCWGDARSGGVGRREPSDEPALTAERVRIPTATAVAATPGQTCALLSDSSVSCWYRPPFRAPIDTFVVLDVGASRDLRGAVDFCARDDVSWYCVRLGGDSEPAAVQRIVSVGDGDVMEVRDRDVLRAAPGEAVFEWNFGRSRCSVSPGVVSLTGFPGLALTGRGTVVTTCAEEGSEALAAVTADLSGLSRIQEIEGGPVMGCALADGEVTCWARGTSPSVILLPAAATEIGVALLSTFACALVADDSVWCWGDNGVTLGDGSTRPSADPVRVLGLP